MTEIEIAWLAAYLEGEGCFTWLTRKQDGRKWGYPVIMVGSTDLDVLQKAARIMDSCKPYRLKRYQPGRPMWRTQIGGKRSLAIMGLVLPHMGKRRSARIRELFHLAAARPGHPKGEKCYQAKLSRLAVQEIRTSALRFQRGFMAVMARKHGVKHGTVWNVVNGQTWN